MTLYAIIVNDGRAEGILRRQTQSGVIPAIAQDRAALDDLFPDVRAMCKRHGWRWRVETFAPRASAPDQCSGNGASGDQAAREEAIPFLVALGIKKAQARAMVARHVGTVEEIVTAALKEWRK